LLTDAVTGRALVLQSPLFTHEPFATSAFNLTNDQRTRVLLFATNADPAVQSTFIVTAVSAQGVQYQLPIEWVGPAAGLQGTTTIIVRLPQDTTLHGDLTVNLVVGSNRSNNVVFAIQ
jgi:hypothetical protein